VDTVVPQDERILREQLDRAQSKLEGLLRALRAADDALASSSAERKQHQLVARACEALEELNAEGAAGLFWGAQSVGREEQLRDARARVDAFEKHYAEIEERRHALFERVLLQQEGTELLAGDVLERERLEQERENEWLVEREISALPDRETLMPWSRSAEEDSRFRRSLGGALAASFVFAVVAHSVVLPASELSLEREAPPKRITRLLDAPRPVPRPPQREEPLRPKPALAKASRKQPPPDAQRAQGPGAGAAAGAESGPKGLMAFRERLAGVAAQRPDARFGLAAPIASAGDAPSGPPQRSMITSQAPGSSGGINLASLSRGGGGSGGRGMERVQVVQVASAIVGGGGAGGAGAAGASGRSGPPLGRTDEEIQIVFDRHKAELYRVYNRELRGDPALQGKVVLRMTIEPDGSVSLCVLQATDMNAPQLTAEVVARVRAFDFGAKPGIAAVTILYPIDFLPAT
jgi:hypothetical protein